MGLEHFGNKGVGKIRKEGCDTWEGENPVSSGSHWLMKAEVPLVRLCKDAQFILH